MANNFNLPSVADLQSLSVDPRTKYLNEIPNDIERGLSLSEAIGQRQLKAKQQELLIKQLDEKLGQMEAAKQAGQLAVPTSPLKPVSTQVPEANLGNVANVVPQTGQLNPQEPSPIIPIEQNRRAEFVKNAIQAQPKEFLGDIAKEMYPKPSSSNAEFSVVPGILSKNNKPMILDKRTGEIKEGTTDVIETKGITTPLAEQRKAYAEQQILNNIVPGLSRNKLLKDSSNIIFQDQRLQALNEFAQGNPTKNETQEITIAFDRVLRGGGALPVSEIKALAPSSAIANGAALWQWITANPTGTNQQALIDRLVRGASRERRVAENKIKTQLSKMKLAIAPEYAKDKEFMQVIANNIATQSQPEERDQADIRTKDPDEQSRDISMQLNELSAQIEELQNKQ